MQKTAMLTRAFLVMTKRRDRVLIKLGVAGFFFAVCYLAQYPARQELWSNLVRNDEIYEINGVNSNVRTVWSKCRSKIDLTPRTESEITSPALQEKIRTINKSNQQEMTVMEPAHESGNLSIVAISGTESLFAFSDPLIDSYKKVLSNCGYAVEMLPETGGLLQSRRKRSPANHFKAMFCLSGSCRKTGMPPGVPIKVNRIDALSDVLSSLNDEVTCANPGVLTCLPAPATKSETSILPTSRPMVTTWAVLHKGLPTFATVQSEFLPRFTEELQRAVNMSARRFLPPTLSILDRPVRVSVFVLATGNAPTLFYLHQDCVIRIGGFVKFGQQEEHDADLLWNSAQFRRYLTKYYGTEAADIFVDKVRMAVAAVFQNVPAANGHTNSDNCRDCYQILDVTLLVSADLNPIVVTVANHEQMPDVQLPKKIFENIIALLLDSVPFDTQTLTMLEQFISSVLSATDPKTICDLSDKSCISEADLTKVIESVQFNLRAQSYDLQYIGSTKTGHASVIAKVLDLAFSISCAPEDSDYRNEVPANQQSARSSIIRIPDRCQYDSAFRSLLVDVKTHPAFELTPAFHPLITAYRLNLPFNFTSVDMEFVPADCDTETTLADGRAISRSRPETFVIGLGMNIITATVVKRTETDTDAFLTYSFRVHRASREEKIGTVTGNPMIKCGWRQTCDVKLFPNEPCGLQPEPFHTGNSGATVSPNYNVTEMDRWILPCLNCDDEASCDWNEAKWSADTYRTVSSVDTCVQNKKLIFIGDSTNRGIMAYIRQQFNATLVEDDKIHSVKTYNRVDGANATFTFAYYPQFWLPQNRRPSFAKTFRKAVKEAEPLQNNSNTVFIVGGLQFLRSHHLRDLRKSLDRANLQGAKVIIKTLGSGFFIPTQGIKRVEPDDIQKLLSINQDIISRSRQLGYSVVDTFAMTASRYNEFRAGKCSCHFHSVEANSPNVTTANTHKTYTVHGHINALYSQNVLHEVCSN